MLLKIELNVLKEEWKSLQKMLNDIISSNIPDSSKLYDGTPLYGKINELSSIYSELMRRTQDILRSAKVKVKEEVFPRYLSFPSMYDSDLKQFYLSGWKVVSFLNSMAIECSKTLTLINELVAEISLSPPEEEELKTLENDIKEKIEPSFPLYSSELIQSIKSLRKGEFLASTLICGRLLTVIIDKCKKKLTQERKVKQKLENVVDFLKNRGILSGEEREKILDSIRLYRNKFAHEIGTYPSIEETILIISGTTLLLKKIAENKDEFNFLV
jgi:hypothetical protein